MKTRLTLAAIACCFAFAQPVLAERKYISDSEKTTAVRLGEGTYETVGESDTNGIAVTRDGVLIISPDTDGSLSVTDGAEETDICILPAVKLDFESDDIIRDVQFSGSRKQDENGFYLDGSEEDALIDISAVGIKDSVIRIKFRMYKSDAEASDLIKLTGTDGTTLSYITLTKRTEESVYLSYLNGGNMTRMRNVLINVGEWLDAEAVINLDTKKADLYVAGAPLLTDTPVAAADTALGQFSFGVAVDDVSFSCGEEIDGCALEIGIEEASVADDGVYMIDPQAKIELLGELHEIDAKYISLKTEGTGIVPQGGRIFADGRELSEPQSVKISCAAVVSGVEYSAEKTIEISAGGTDGEIPDRAAALKPQITPEGVLIRVFNAEGTELKIIVCGEEESGAKNYIAADWTPDAADAQFVMDAPLDAAELSVYILDRNSGVNLLQQEGV